MPISPEKRALYPADWKAISKRIRERAGQRCEQCRAPNGQTIARTLDGARYTLEDGATHDAETGELLGHTRGSELPDVRFVRVVLTVAHLNHDPTDSRDEVLRALCQRCHLRLDRDQHATNARATRRKRKAHRELF